MKHKVSFKFTPPITRVHNIFRIRTVVKAVIKENEKKKLPSDDEIGLVLAKSGLSKFRREKIQDRIMRRARDHLLTASYMGLLTRIGRPFGYSATTAGKILNIYDAEEECPKDAKEEAVFIDKILRLKLTNVYDLQYGMQYVELRSRPCLYILHVLQRTNWLHEHQIAVATASNRCDPILEDRITRSMVSKICQYGEPSKKSLQEFYNNYKIKKSDRKNMTRNVRPLLDWCESIGLIASKEVEKTSGRWYNLTNRGKVILGIYGKKTPIWYADLGETPAAKAALLIFSQYAITFGFDVSRLLESSLRTGLITKKISELVDEIEDDIGVKIVNGDSTFGNQIDFTLEYDIPPEERKYVMSFLKTICKVAHARFEKVIHVLEVNPLNELEIILEKEQQNIRGIITGRFAERTAISSDPLLARVSALIPSVGILGQYKSDFEKEVVILLRLIGFKAIKYQGQLADRCSKLHVTRFFENNPDILITNGIECLVECKSVGEWKSPLSTNKSIPKELLIYQQYFPQVNSESVVLIYEGSLDGDSQKLIISIFEDSPDILFVTKNYLINCIYQQSFRERFIKIIKEPGKFKPEERILVAH